MPSQIQCPEPGCGQLVDVGELECPYCRCDLSTLLPGEESEPEMDAVFAAGAGAPPLDSADDPFSGAPQDVPGLDSGRKGSPPPIPAPAPAVSPPVPQPAVSATPAAGLAAPADVARTSSGVRPTLVLEVEGHEEVIFRGKPTRRIEIASAEVTIGRRDPANQIYPDIDLREFHRQGMGFVSRRHAQIIVDRGRHYVEDLGGQETTQLAETPAAKLETVPLKERRPLQLGSRIMIGEAVVLKVAEIQELP